MFAFYFQNLRCSNMGVQFELCLIVWTALSENKSFHWQKARHVESVCSSHSCMQYQINSFSLLNQWIVVCLAVTRQPFSFFLLIYNWNATTLPIYNGKSSNFSQFSTFSSLPNYYLINMKIFQLSQILSAVFSVSLALN